MDLEVTWVPVTGKMNKWKLMDEFFKKKNCASFGDSELEIYLTSWTDVKTKCQKKKDWMV